jgi:hypothetical protein
MSSTPRTADNRHLRTVAQHDLGGYGDGMQVMRHGDAVYVGHFGPSGMGTSVLDASDPSSLRLVRQWPAPHGSHTHKVQVADGLLLVNHEQFRGGEPYSAGMAVYDLADPFDPRQIGWFDSTGRGVHRIVWEGGRYAYVSAIPDGFDDRIWVIVDMRDPARPVEAGRWWWPGQWTGGGERLEVPEGKRYAAHHAMVDGDRAYLGYGDAGLVVLDIADRSNPKQIGTLNWEPGGDTHTCLPLAGRDLLVVTDEVVTEGRASEPHYARVVDVADPEAPRVVSVCPPPPDEFYDRGLRFGPHNLHENRPGTYRSNSLVFCTYFNAGLRVYDVADAEHPVEVAHWVPETPPGQAAAQINDVFVGADLDIWVTDRVHGGVYRLAADDELAERMRRASL